MFHHDYDDVLSACVVCVSVACEGAVWSVRVHVDAPVPVSLCVCVCV